MLINPRGLNFTQKSLEVAVDDLIVARYSSANALHENSEAVFELLQDSIEAFALRTGLFNHRFVDAYLSAVRMTTSTLNKPDLSGVSRFKNMSIEDALRWLKSRLLNNIKTVLTNPKSKNWINNDNHELVEIYAYDASEVEAELALMSCEQIKQGLHTLFLQGADVSELEYLAKRYKIDLNAVIGQYEFPIIIERTAVGNPQLTFDF